MATLEHYGAMASNVYYVGKGDDDVIALRQIGWAAALGTDLRKAGGLSGFYAATYVNSKSKEVVVAIRGTASLNDVVSDLKIGLGIGPNEAGDGYRLAKIVQQNYPGSKISLTGHSLGGGLCQIIGFWTGIPLSPSMHREWRMSKPCRISIFLNRNSF